MGTSFSLRTRSWFRCTSLLGGSAALRNLQRERPRWRPVEPDGSDAGRFDDYLLGQHELERTYRCSHHLTARFWWGIGMSARQTTLRTTRFRSRGRVRIQLWADSPGGRCKRPTSRVQVLHRAAASAGLCPGRQDLPSWRRTTRTGPSVANSITLVLALFDKLRPAQQRKRDIVTVGDTEIRRATEVKLVGNYLC